MYKNWVRIGWLVVVLLVTFTTSKRGLVYSQSTEQSAVVVKAITNDLVVVQQLVYGPKGGKSLTDLGADYQASDPNARWVLVYQGAARQYVVKDAKTNQTIHTISWDQLGGGAIGLSPSTRYLTYTEVRDTNDGMAWTLHIIDLTDNTERQFGDILVDGENTGSAKAIQGALTVDGWDNTEAILVLAGFSPNSDEPSNGHYLLDVSSLQPSTNPTALPVLKKLPDGDHFMFSPDNRQVAYLSESATNPPQNYERTGPSPIDGNGPYNTLSLVNLGTANIKVVATAAPGAGIDKLLWSDDGKRLYFTAGDFGGSEYINNPMLDYVDLTSNQVVKGKTIFTGSTEQFDDYQICGENLYYITLPSHGLASDAALWVAPLNDLSKRATLDLPDSNLYYSLNGCIAPPK